MIRSNRISFLALMCVLLMAGAAAAQDTADVLMLNFNNLMPLNESVDGIYEGWAIIGGAPVSTGVFNVNDAGQPVQPGTDMVIEEFMSDASLMSASDIKISLEPVGDSDPAPSGLIVLAGMIDGESANLAAPIPGLSMLESATGAYILATPSDNETAPDNDNMGVWFLTMPGPEAGLVGLPDLGDHWTYEGWAVDLSGGSPMPYSTGTFAMASGFDSDEAGCMAGGPPFPGQDFTAYHCGPELTLDSGDFAIVVSIEPVPDNSPAPFQFKPLAGMVPTDALGMNNALNNQVCDTFPTGMATIMSVTPVETTTLDGLKAAYR